MIVGKDFVILRIPKAGIMFRAWVAHEYNYRCLCPAWLQKTKIAKKYILDSIRFCIRKNYFKLSEKPIPKNYFKIALYKFLVWRDHNSELLHNVFCTTWGIKGKHNTHIFTDRELLTVLRNPYSHVISNYQYWRMRTTPDNRKLYNFVKYINDYSLQECVRRMRKEFGVEHINYPMGLLSYCFIRVLFKDPVKIFTMSAEEFDEYCVSDDYKKDMYPLKFFRTETMNQQMYEYLKSKPYLDSQIIDEIFKEAEPKNVSKKREDAVWDEETKAHFEKNEKFYIRMVSELAPLPEDDF